MLKIGTYGIEVRPEVADAARDLTRGVTVPHAGRPICYSLDYWGQWIGASALGQSPRRGACLDNCPDTKKAGTAHAVPAFTCRRYSCPGYFPDLPVGGEAGSDA